MSKAFRCKRQLIFILRFFRVLVYWTREILALETDWRNLAKRHTPLCKCFECLIQAPIRKVHLLWSNVFVQGTFLCSNCQLLWTADVQLTLNDLTSHVGDNWSVTQGTSPAFRKHERSLYKSHFITHSSHQHIYTAFESWAKTDDVKGMWKSPNPAWWCFCDAAWEP